MLAHHHPFHDAVFDEAIACFSDLLFLLFGLSKLSGIADGHGAGETIGQFHFVELFLDGLAQGKVIDVAQDEQRFDDLPEGLESLIEGVLAGI